MDSRQILKEIIKKVVKSILYNKVLLSEIHYEDIRVSKGWREFFSKYGSLEKVQELGYDIEDLYVNFNSHAKDKMDKRIVFEPDKNYYGAGAHSDPGGIYAYPLEYIITHPLSETYGINEYPYMRVLLNRNNKGGMGMGYADDDNNLQARKKDTLKIDKIDNIMDVRYLMIKAARIMPSIYGGYEELFRNKNMEEMGNFYKNMQYIFLREEYGSSKGESYSQLLYFLLKNNVYFYIEKIKNDIKKEYKEYDLDTIELNVNTFEKSLFQDYYTNDYYKKKMNLRSLDKISSKNMNAVLRKMGFGVVDSKETNPSKAFIVDEPSQAVFLDRQSFEVLDVYKLYESLNYNKKESEKEIGQRYLKMLKKIIIYIFGKDAFLSKEKSGTRVYSNSKSSNDVHFDVVTEIKGDIVVILRSNDIINNFYGAKFSGHREDSKYKFDPSDRFTENKALLLEIFIRNNIEYQNKPFFSYQFRPDERLEDALPMIKHGYEEKMKTIEKNNTPNE
jgi:hypothetical protein